MLDLHYNTVSSEQRELLEKLGSLGGVLVGGTALSLQIGHRRSYDLDFVVQEKITDDLLRLIKTIVRGSEITQRLLSETQYTAFVNDVKITFFQDEASLFYNPKNFDKFLLANVKDIFSSKLYVMGRRATWRDYADVAVCLDQVVCSLDEGIEEAVARYKVSKRWILDPLTYFDDLEMTPIEWGEKEYSEEQIKQIIVDSTKMYL